MTKLSILLEGQTILTVYAPNRSIKFYEAKTDRTLRRNK